jgi:PPOX class probable FMN-dependent enzyme
VTTVTLGERAESRYRQLTVEQIREVLGPPGPAVEAKISSQIGLTARRFIAHSPFVCLATGSDSGADCSPRGDGPGFVKVLDDVTLAIPDRIGNALADSFSNICHAPAVGLLFLVPGLRETLRVNGKGYITDDAELLERFYVDGRRAKLALIVNVEEAYFHCGKALIRSRLWDPEMQSLALAMTCGVNVFSLQRIETNSVNEPSSELSAGLEQSYVREI